MEFKMKSLCGLAEVSELIMKNKILIIAGDENLLLQLPLGNWIGGSIPYFMKEYLKNDLELTFLNFDSFSLPSIFAFA